MIHNIIKKRHTTRLMDDTISDEDVKIILDSARSAPSKNKIYGYKIYALTNSEKGKQLKKRLCENVTLYKDPDDQETVYLLQTLAPLVLIFISCPAPEHQMLGIVEKNGSEVYEHDHESVANKLDKIMMTKNSLRDAIISATYAQLTAEGLGLGTAFVACGLEDLMYDPGFKDLWKQEFGDSFITKPVEPAVILCIGPKHEKITDLYENGVNGYSEEYLDGRTDFTRGGREKSFFINSKQQELIKII